ncbi:plant basic secretory protein (BSP) family protein [Senna tora]|uniref:Plant basic secretory protein (BSP) family protein n=1 Tax=Senna tora TaxID=362788 RepID=A0A834SWT2_9FABA|nr:plant basic secretory protein (BSP) family protein [Senna tora]
MVQHFVHVSSPLLLVLLAAMIAATQAVEYTVTNTALATAGGVRFRDQIGAAYAKQTMDSATHFIWRTFQQQNSPADRKNVQKVSLFVEDKDGVAYTTNNEIHLSSRYVGSYTGDLRREVSGVLYHEMTHVWQWDGNGQANGGLIEGIADFVRLKAGYAPSHWVKPGQGDKWDQGYDVTAYFLDYCNSLRNGFVAELNKKMRSGYSDHYFVDLLGKSVDQLWKDYKAKYGN